MARLSDLPVELLALVLDHIQKTSTTSSFKKCLFVRKSWHKEGSRLLWRDISTGNANLRTSISQASFDRLQQTQSVTIVIIPPELKRAEWDHLDSLGSDWDALE